MAAVLLAADVCHRMFLYCDLAQLIQGSWVCRAWRNTLDNPEFVVQWQTVCHYLESRHCYCDRT